MKAIQIYFFTYFQTWY